MQLSQAFPQDAHAFILEFTDVCKFVTNIVLIPSIMEQGTNDFAEGQEATGAQAQDAEDVAAALLLREVEDFLRDGQPRHAIAHIMDVTGVDRPSATSFVTELQSGLL